jgi:hypothetical protein
LEEKKGRKPVIAYEFYCFDSNDTNETRFIGIIPERRKNPLRITRESVLNLGRKFTGVDAGLSSLYFIQIEVCPTYLPRECTAGRT